MDPLAPGQGAIWRECQMTRTAAYQFMGSAVSTVVMS